jgi:phosphate transport system protein
MERYFDTELDELKKSVAEMGTLSSSAIARSIEALKTRSADLAARVIDDDRDVDRLELVIDDKCIDLIARFQPMAKDLRFITTGMKINAELERIADLAVDIAERTLEIVDKPLLKPLVDIPKMTSVAQRMIGMAIESFVNEDADLARKVLLVEPEANELRDAIQRELIDDYMAKDCATVPRAVQLLLVARFLERICDHATNIAEEVIYMVQAEVVRHHRREPDES